MSFAQGLRVRDARLRRLEIGQDGAAPQSQGGAEELRLDGEAVLPGR
ncbi:hypothetical protein [Nonomuraea sp. NPDC049480]